MLYAALFYLFASFVVFTIKLLPLKWGKNPAPPLGRVMPAIIYSFTGAMSPAKKESAYLHLPTYFAGLVFHIGLFVAMLNLFALLIGADLPGWVEIVFLIVFTSGFLCGLGILLKRFTSNLLKSISNPDDYISNLLVNGFLAINALDILLPEIRYILYLFSALLIFYLPLGKLKHSFFFFSSRIALGIFYGSRGVWKTKSFLNERKET